MFRPLVFLWFLTLAQGSLLALPDAEFFLKKNTLTLSEKTQLRLEFAWDPQEGAYAFALPELPLKNLAATRIGESQESFDRQGQPWTRKTFLIELTPMAAGEGRIESFTVRYVNPSTGLQNEWTVPAQSLKIQNPQSNVWKGAAAALAGLVVLGMGIFGLRKKRPAAGQSASHESPAEKAFRALSASLTQDGNEPKKGAFTLNAGLRSFVYDYYQLAPRGSSVRELAELLKQKGLPREEWLPLAGLLEELERSKFQSQDLSREDFERLKAKVFDFIKSKRVLGAESSILSSGSQGG